VVKVNRSGFPRGLFCSKLKDRENLDHLLVAIGNPFQFAAHPFHGGWKLPFPERCTVAQSARLAGEDQDLERVAPFMARAGGGWIVTGLVVMDRFRAFCV
jgi:hypothetical protein